ncbi:MAG: ABC transporter permease [Phycisphaerae bacterium]
MLAKAADAILFLPSLLTGPVFSKELRASSRRRRYYVLRSTYVLLLLAFIALIWLDTVSYTVSGSAYYASRMAEAGRTIIAVATWFQFFTCQLVAIVLLSSAISDEITHRTLGTLMTTPINSLQIVAGKLLSRLWQILLLLAISLPVLAVVRVFGGVPWDYLLGSACVTVCTCLFVGSLSLWFSIFQRRTYKVIIITVVVVGILFALVPILAVFIADEFGYYEDDVLGVFTNFNPYVGLLYMTEVLMYPSLAGSAGVWFSWVLLCGVLLGASAVVVLAGAAYVRKVALGQASGRTHNPDRPGLLRRLFTWSNTRSVNDGRIIPVRGLPMVWKELRHVRRNRRRTVFRGGAALALLSLTYLLCASENILRDDEVHMVYLLVFFSVGVLGTATTAGSAVGEEKEARTLSLLLISGLSAEDIILGKAIGILRRCWPYWGLGALHLGLFTLCGMFPATTWLHLGIIVGGVVALLTGVGLYFGSVFRRTVTAVVLTILLPIVLWVLIPILLVLGMDAVSDDSFPARYADATPWAQIVVVVDHDFHGYRGYSGHRNSSYHWPSGRQSRGETMARISAWSAVYATAGLLLTIPAARRLRRGAA